MSAERVPWQRYTEFRIETGIPVFFCDPASPWQRGSNENTRPRKTLGWDTPADRLAKLLVAAA